MHSIRASFPAQHDAAPAILRQELEFSNSQAQHYHPDSLMDARVSGSVALTLNHVAAPSHLDQQRVLSLLRCALHEGSLRLKSSCGMKATYQAIIKPPRADKPYSIANLTTTELTICVKFNPPSEYEITHARVDGHLTSQSVDLFRPRPTSTNYEASSGSTQQSKASSSLALQHSRGQLVETLIQQNNPGEFPGTTLPVRASVSAQHAHRSGTAPDAAWSNLGLIIGGSRIKRSSASDEQIKAELYHLDGRLKSCTQILTGLHAAKLGATPKRIRDQMRNATVEGTA